MVGFATVPAAVLVLASACAEPAPPTPAPPAVKSAAARASRYQECWNRFNDKAWDRFGSCYGDNAVSESVDAEPALTTGRNAIVRRDQDEAVGFPDRRGEVRLILANGDRLASAALYTATNTGPMPPGPDGQAAPATGKSVGDQGTLMSQLGVSKAR